MKKVVQSSRNQLEAVGLLVRAYENVFGQEGQRTEYQKLVWRDLERIGFGGVPINVHATDAQGRIDPLKLAVNSGKNEFFKHIEGQLFIARNPDLLSEPDSKQ